MSLTDNDRKLIVLGFQCFESQPKVDFAKLATLGGYKSAESAGVMYRNAKKKLLSSTPNANNTTSTTTTNSTATTPTTTPKKRKPAAPKTNADGSPVTKRARQSKPKNTTTTNANANKKSNTHNNNNANTITATDSDEDSCAAQQQLAREASDLLQVSQLLHGGKLDPVINDEDDDVKAEADDDEGDEDGEDVFARYTQEAEDATSPPAEEEEAV
ncbi:MAG: hypothetical protein M1836_000839 [Candelina mexicana]|nr:MAG: hypothetical protein M1836_000839 [Candelina mexicana]